MTYELTVLVAPTVDLTKDADQKDIIVKLVGDKGSVKEVTSMGKRTLAYAIKKQTEATYLLAIVEGIVKVGDLEKKAKIMDKVLRLMLIAKE